MLPQPDPSSRSDTASSAAPSEAQLPRLVYPAEAVEPLHADISRLKGEVATLQRQTERLRQEQSERESFWKSISEAFERQRKELMDHAQASAVRARDAERELTIIRSKGNDELAAARIELEQLRPAVSIVTKHVADLIETIQDFTRAKEGNYSTPFLAMLHRDLPRLADAVKKLRLRLDERDVKHRELEQRFKELKTTLLTEREQHRHALSEAHEGKRAIESSLRSELAALGATLESERLSQQRRNTLLDQLLEAERNRSRVPEGTAEIVARFEQLARRPMREILEGLRSWNATERQQFQDSLVLHASTRSKFAQAVARIEAHHERLSTMENLDEAEIDLVTAVRGSLAKLGAGAVERSGNLAIVTALSPTDAGTLVEQLSDQDLRALFGLYLAYPRHSHVLNSHRFLAIAEQLPPASRAAAAQIAPSADSALQLIFGGPSIRAAVRVLQQMREDRWSDGISRKQAIISADYQREEFVRAREILSALRALPRPYIQRLLNPYEDKVARTSPSMAVLGFDIRDALLFAPRHS